MRAAKFRPMLGQLVCQAVGSPSPVRRVCSASQVALSAGMEATQRVVGEGCSAHLFHP